MFIFILNIKVHIFVVDASKLHEKNVSFLHSKITTYSNKKILRSWEIVKPDFLVSLLRLRDWDMMIYAQITFFKKNYCLDVSTIGKRENFRRLKIYLFSKTAPSFQIGYVS